MNKTNPTPGTPTVRRSIWAAAVVAALLTSLSACDKKDAGGASAGTGKGNGSASAPPAAADLAAERAAHRTRLIREGPSPQESEPESPPPEAQEVVYVSGPLQLKAWVSKPPADGKKRPAVVYLHGGFAFGGEDWAETAPYREASFIVMTPMLRGENGNPGFFEMFYGEVDDAIAAGRHLASLPYVDSKQVFIAGHSSGGAETILAAMLPSPFAVATPIGGYVTMEGLMNVPQFAAEAPFDVRDARELRLRSAGHFAGTLRCPMFFLCGTEDPFALQGTDAFVADAARAGKTCELHYLPGDHHSSKQQAIRKSVELFQRHIEPKQDR